MSEATASLSALEQCGEHCVEKRDRQLDHLNTEESERSNDWPEETLRVSHRPPPRDQESQRSRNLFPAAVQFIEPFIWNYYEKVTSNVLNQSTAYSLNHSRFLNLQGLENLSFLSV